MIKQLNGKGYFNIWILDNNSTYPPLLEWYKTCKNKVILLDENMGPYALWNTQAFYLFERSYYVYTDADILVADQTPNDFLAYFKKTLLEHPGFSKIGFSLKIDDLPDSYSRKNSVVEWENIFWTKEISHELFDAAIDTTFALYPPFIAGGHKLKAIRTGGQYTAHHLPWYEDSLNPSDEEKYFIRHITKDSSWYQKKC